ncbi:MAG: nucleotidyltransferase domain-containing protein [Deltaproteobacteria bacterium]|nr:nucleotidyltransferase domain-containing protein [Deltaproteobacteria bacterium]
MMSRSVPASLRPALEQLARRLRELFGDRLRELRLYGSYARGEASEDSDVDVLVVVDGLTDLEIGAAAGEAAPVVLATGLPLAPLPMSSEHLAELRRDDRLFARVLDEEGIRL